MINMTIQKLLEAWLIFKQLYDYKFVHGKNIFSLTLDFMPKNINGNHWDQVE